MSDGVTVTAGVRCPGCGTIQIRVLETSRAEEGIVRLRECRVCGCRIHTIETILSTSVSGSGRIRAKYPDVGATGRQQPLRKP